MANPLIKQVLRNIAEKAGHEVASDPKQPHPSPTGQESELRLEPQQKIALSELIQKHQKTTSHHQQPATHQSKNASQEGMLSLSDLATKRRNRS
ncbi:hypothetical protein [Tindallia californiensis]|uniref:Uncharacterized protein n=1 Tax=Tindallia californiensis TaxID=159292 RepID=A0A1H3Q758_9FIRM|nr:hypothetical protein [Tindallia californiensis]SDZ09083.1 hypothetical protein SAMN05192546_108118 [Tindallia californiensis]